MFTTFKKRTQKEQITIKSILYLFLKCKRDIFHFRRQDVNRKEKTPASCRNSIRVHTGGLNVEHNETIIMIFSGAAPVYVYCTRTGQGNLSSSHISSSPPTIDVNNMS